MGVSGTVKTAATDRKTQQRENRERGGEREGVCVCVCHTEVKVSETTADVSRT